MSAADLKVAALERLVSQLRMQLSQLERRPVTLPTHAVAALPKAIVAGQVIYVPDATGGPALALSNGADWLKLAPSGVIS